MTAEQERMASPLPGGVRSDQNSTATADDADIHLQRLLLAPDFEQPWYRSIVQDVKDLIHPKKLPPLVLTSKPVPVEELWGAYGGEGKKAGVFSGVIHVGGDGLVFVFWGQK